MKASHFFPSLCLSLLVMSGCSFGAQKHDPSKEFLLNAQYIDHERILCLYDCMTESQQLLELYNTNSHKTQTIKIPEDLGRVLPAGIVKGENWIYVFEGYKAAIIHPETLQVENLVSLKDLSFSDMPLSKDGCFLFRMEEGLAAAPIENINAFEIVKEDEDKVFYHWAKWSPDGDKVAYFRGVEENALDSLCIQTIRTKEEIVITLDIETNNFQWSNQSTQIILVGSRPNGPLSLFLFDVETGELKKEINLVQAGLTEINGISILDFYQNNVLIQIFRGVPGDEKSPILIYHLEEDTWEYLTPEDYDSTSASFSLDGSEVAVCNQNSSVQLEIFPVP